MDNICKECKIKDIGDRNFYFCSILCRNRYVSRLKRKCYKRVNMICKMCGINYVVRKCHANRSKYCSRKCKANSMRKNIQCYMLIK